MSSTIRTPCPTRVAPQARTAPAIESTPAASPAWIVYGQPCVRRWTNEGRKRSGGKPSSAPAMSKPATVPLRSSRTRSAAVRFGSTWRIEVSSWRTTIVRPRARLASIPSRRPSRHRGDGLGLGQPLLRVLLGRPAGLAVDDAVGGEVLDELPGDPAQVLPRLHDGDRVLEGLEVAHQRAGVGGLDEPAPERLRAVGRGRRQLVPDLGGQLQDRRGAHAAVEVVVQGDLGQRAEAFEIELRHVGQSLADRPWPGPPSRRPAAGPRSSAAPRGACRRAAPLPRAPRAAGGTARRASAARRSRSCS